MNNDAIVLLEPASIDQRIINQYSYFMVVPHGIRNVEDFLESRTKNTVKYIISHELCWTIRDMLDQLNFSERMVLPGLEGICSWIGRRYYVKK